MSDAAKDASADFTTEPEIPGSDNRPTDRGSRRGSASRGSAITIGTVIALVIATGLTILGVGSADNAVANFDASSWMWSSNRSEVDRVNGVTGRVDTRTKVKDSQNHDLHVSQTDKYLILRDLNTGAVSALDLTTLQINAVLPTTPGLGVSVALHKETAFVVDSVQGQIRQLDPRTLTPVGDAIVLPGGLIAGSFDEAGILWIAVPTEGTVVAIRPGTGGAGPAVIRTVTVTPPGHDLALSVLDNGAAVLDNTSQTLTTIRGEKLESTAVPVDRPALLPVRSGGSTVPVTVPDNRLVVIVNGPRINQFTVPGTGPVVPAVVFAGRVYCADSRAGIVYEFDSNGQAHRQIRIASAGGALELEIRENHLFINAPDGSTARVIDDRHRVKDVNKYEDGVLGGDPPPAPPPTPRDPEPRVSVPGKPQNVTASAGDASVRIGWRKARENGAPITKYIVEGGGKSITIGSRQRSVQIKGLTNGKLYRFTVKAVNAKGAGPKASAPPVTPSADVPNPPASVTATAKPNGTVDVTWPPANGLGRKIRSYQVTAITGGAQTPVGEVKVTKLTVAAGTVPFGTQVAFTVVAINDRNAGSESSPVSNTVVPFTTPGAPNNLVAATATNVRGGVQVSWQNADDNGRPIEKYIVAAAGKTTDVIGNSVMLTGLADDTAVQVSVHAVNEAGDGPIATATARTIGVPTVTVQRAGPTQYNSIAVTFTPNNKGGTAVCQLRVTGGGTARSTCTTRPMTLTVSGLWPNNSYPFTLTVTSAAGTATATGSRSTSTMRFTVICPNNYNGYCSGGIYAYASPSQQGTARNPGLAVGATGTPQCRITGNREINAEPWGAKKSTQWLRFTYQGATSYFPFAWARLDGGDNLSMLPAC